MLLRPGGTPTGDGWAFEVKYDGWRASVDTPGRTCEKSLVRRVTIACLCIASMWVDVAGAATGPKVSVTVKKLSPTSTLVRIANRDHVAYKDFVVQSVNKPKIVAAARPCAVQRDGNSAGATFNWRYRAACRKPLAPGKTIEIRLTTSTESGKIDVFVVVNNALVHISRSG